MKSSKIYVGMAVLTLILTAGVVSVSAYQGDYSKTGPNTTPERHEAMEAAFENEDYNAWSALMADRGRVTQVINEENFAQFAEARKLSQAGDVAGADAVRAELGLRTSSGEKTGAGHMGCRGGAKGQGQGRGQCGGQGFVDNDGNGICDNK